MSITEETCRWAYAKAMRNENIRRALEEVGRAIYLDDNASDESVFPASNRYVLSRVELHGERQAEALVYCNGVCVA